jgi:hypothetical protein
MLLLFGRWGDINIHLDVGVDEIWILEIKLRHHAALNCLSCSLFVEARAFRDSMMVRMRRQRAIAYISLINDLHREWSLRTLHQMVLMMVMPDSIPSWMATDMPNWRFRHCTVWAHWLSIAAIWSLYGMIVLISFYYLHLLLRQMLNKIFSPTRALMINGLLHLVILEVAKWHWGKALFPFVSLGSIKLLIVLAKVSRADHVNIFLPHMTRWCLCTASMMILFEQLHILTTKRWCPIGGGISTEL